MNSSDMLKRFRGKSLLTQKEVANELGISRQLYNTYENNILKCQLDTLLKIFKVLNVSEEDMKSFSFALQQDYISYIEA